MIKRVQELEREWASRLCASRRVVIKLGTNVVTGGGDEIRLENLKTIVNSVASLIASGRQVAMVSSGAVGLGACRLGLGRGRTRNLVMRQACAAIGQSLLMRAYEELFSGYGLTVAQVLLTEEDFKDRRRYLNLRNTVEKLLKLRVVPIVNENDTVSTAELQSLDNQSQRVFGDNDRLAALVMSKLPADALILLTDVDGLLMEQKGGAVGKNGLSESRPAVVPLVTELTSELRSAASGAASEAGRGGMITKLEAAEIAMRAGGVAVIANGTSPRILDRIFAGEPAGTVFFSQSRMNGKRRWIAFAAGVRGRLVVTEGAREAIVGGRASLLASGVTRVEAPFDLLDVVSISDEDGREFARGIVNYGSDEAERLIAAKGRRTGTNQKRQTTPVLVTRNNIAIL